MWDREIRAMVSTHAIMAASVFMATVVPVIFLPGFSVYGTHLSWLYSVSAGVSGVSVGVFWLLGLAQPTKKLSLGSKVPNMTVLDPQLTIGTHLGVELKRIFMHRKNTGTLPVLASLKHH